MAAWRPGLQEMLLQELRCSSDGDSPLAPLAMPVVSLVCSADALPVPVAEVMNVEAVAAELGESVAVADWSLAVGSVSEDCGGRPAVSVKAPSNDSARSDTLLPSAGSNVAVATTPFFWVKVTVTLPLGFPPRSGAAIWPEPWLCDMVARMRSYGR